MAYWQGNYEQAHVSFQESLDCRQEIGDMVGTVASLRNLGFVSLRLKNEQAQHYFTHALTLSTKTDVITYSLTIIAGFSCLLAQEGRLARAAELAGFVQNHSAFNNDVKYWLDHSLSLLVESAKLKEAMERGKMLKLDNVIKTLLDEFSEDDGDVAN